MYYAIRKTGPVIQVALLALGLAVFAATGAWGQDKPKRFLVVTSQGYSRYEISEGDVVAFFTGGIECSYLGYTLVADELRYNHATQVASASGKITLTSLAMNLQCETVTLDGAQGLLDIDSPVSGALVEQGLSFDAGAALVHFPPGQMSVDLNQVNIELVGTTEQSLVLRGPNGSVLAAQHLLYAGATGAVTSPGPFTLEATVNSANGDNGTSELNVSQVKLTGASLAGTLDAQGMLRDAVIADALVDAGQARLSAPELKLSLELLTGESGTGYIVDATGVPIAGEADNAQQTVAFTAEHVRVEAAEDEVSQIELSGNVVVDSAGSKMTAQLIQLERRGTGFAISAPDGLQVAFDLATLSGSTPVELPELSSFTSQE